MGAHIMKTTIELADDLTAKAKELATQRGITLRAVIEEGIRMAIREDQNKPDFELQDASVNGNGLQKEFQNKSWTDIREAAYEGRGT